MLAPARARLAAGADRLRAAARAFCARHRLRERAADLWRREQTQLLVSVAATLAVFTFLRKPWLDGAYGAGGWELPSIAWEAVKGWRKLFMLLLPTYALLATRTGLRWSDLEDGETFRPFLVGALLVWAWTPAFAHYNFYFDQPHTLDRLLILGLVALTWKTPLAWPFAHWLAVAMYGQMSVPPLGDDRTDWMMVHDALLLFPVFLWTSIGRRPRMTHFLFIVLCNVGAYYFRPFISKLTSPPFGSWIWDNKLSNLFMASYAVGWLSFLPEGAVASFTRFLDKIQPVLGTLVLAMEGCGLLFFLRRRVTMVALAGCALLHAAIFAFSGVFFWKWMALDVLLLLLVRRLDPKKLELFWLPRLFAPALALCVIVLSPERWFDPPTLTWFSGPLTRVMSLEAVGASGAHYRVAPAFMAPYYKLFPQSSFAFLSPGRTVAGIYGGCSRARCLALEKVRTEADLAAVEKAHGKVSYDDAKARGFDRFIAKFFAAANRRGTSFYWLALPHPPAHIWITARGVLYDFQEPVVEVDVVETLYLWDDVALRTIRPPKIIRAIPVGSPR